MPTNRWRRILLHPLTRLLIGVFIFAAPQAAVLAYCAPRHLSPLPLPATALAAACAVLALYVVGVLIEKRGRDELLLPAPRSLPGDLARGFALGAPLFTAVILILALLGHAQIARTASPPTSDVALALLTFLFVGVNEEILFRGLFFRLLEEWLGTWAALAISALAFGAVHLGNPHATLWGALAIALEAGLLLAGLYALTRSLVFVIAVHWAWNYFEGPIFGTAVSGHREPSLLTTTTSGPTTLTGGDFGPEASIIAVLVCGLVTVAAIALAVREGQIRSRARGALRTATPAPSRT